MTSKDPHQYPVDLVIVGAVSAEIEKLVSALRPVRTVHIVGRSFVVATADSLSILLGTIGVGKINAAITTTALLQRFSPGALWLVGCAGAYLEGPLKLGDVLLSNPVVCGDEGVLTETKVLSSREIGMSLLVHRGEPLYDHIPVSPSNLMNWVLAQTPVGKYQHSLGNVTRQVCDLGPNKDDAAATTCEYFDLVVGPALTVGMTSGDEATASFRYRRYGAWAENMEGSAVVLSCLRHEVPVLECRGISNIAGDRDKERWRIKQAMSHCHGLIRTWLTALTREKVPPLNRFRTAQLNGSQGLSPSKNAERRLCSRTVQVKGRNSD